MWKSLFVVPGALAALLACSAGAAADLTATESRWLQGVMPVLRHALAEKMPLDVVVQPQPAPGAAPLALAFIDGRCKLVFSMRGNPRAQATLDRIEPGLLDAALELMAAHELAHCRRHLDGQWGRLPLNFSADEAPTAQQADLAEMKAIRREEGYADLVGLAWARQHHPQRFARLHAWLVAERSTELVPGSHHDTLAWIVRAGEGADLEGSTDTLFTRVAARWRAGLAEPH